MPPPPFCSSSSPGCIVNRYKGLAALFGDQWIYCERSSSGKGYHILAPAKVEPINRKNIELDLEIWNTGKYVMLTGKFTGSCSTFAYDKTEQVKQIISRYFPEKPKVEVGENLQIPKNKVVKTTTSNQTAAEVIQIAECSRNGELFKALMCGDTSAHNGDDSAADLALCNIVSCLKKLW